jgi:hypothetical protein
MAPDAKDMVVLVQLAVKAFLPATGLQLPD